MAKILSFFGFLFGFVCACVLLAGVTQSGSVSAREEILSVCSSADPGLDDGYGFSVPAAAVCAEPRSN